MSWGRIDDRMPEHPKWTALERQFGAKVWADAMAVWSVVLCYANRNETDGAIEETLLARITPLGRGAIKAAEAMCEVRLMVRIEHGFRLHDFLAYNPSAEKKKADRQADAARKASPKSPPPPDGIHPESERSPAGPVPDSVPPTRTRARAPTPASRPDPTRPDLENTPRGGVVGDQVARAPELPAHTLSRDAEAIRKAVAARFETARVHGPRALRDIDGKPWVALALELRVLAQRDKSTIPELAARLAQGFLDSPRARKAHWPIAWLVENPGEYLAPRSGVSDFSHVDPNVNPADLLADD